MKRRFPFEVGDERNMIFNNVVWVASLKQNYQLWRIFNKKMEASVSAREDVINELLYYVVRQV